MKKSFWGALYLTVFCIASVLASTPAFATNGMNLEGYGPIATGMGGASMAYDNGAAALMNNPATLALMPQGNRLDVALGYLGPHVTAEKDGESAGSSGRAYYMPAFGWIQKSGQMSYGLGMFAQGGMGTDYSKDSFLAYGSGEKVRTEVSVGRLLIPFAFEINKNVSVAATVDYVWAGMDLKMALTGQQFFNMAGMDMSTPIQNQYGTATGNMVTAFAGLYGAGAFNPADPVRWARFDFSDNNDFTGQAKGTGLGGKLGAVFTVNKELSLGVTYHSKTALSDLQTDKAKVSFNVNMDIGYATTGTPNGTYMNTTIPVTGTIEVKDFEWPQMAGVGAAYQVSNNLMIVADYKWINWEDVMKNFKMTFTAAADQGGPTSPAQGFAGTVLDATMYQKWKDQHVIMVGMGYKVTADWMLRAGVNYANNPIPDTYLNALFPAIEKTHVTIGVGYMISKASSVDTSFTYAPEVKQTSGANAPAGATVTHYQTNAQVMYSYRF